MKKYAIFLLLLFSFLSSGSPVEASKIFRMRLVEDLGTLDWNYGEVNPEIISQLMEGLFTLDSAGKPVLALARKYSWDNWQKTKISFYLRKNIFWSDGREICAQDFIDSWERLKDKKFASPYEHFASGIKKAEAKNCEEIQVELSRRMPELPALLAHHVFLPIRKELISKDSALFLKGTSLPVTGAFKVLLWEREQKIVLERNKRYQSKKKNAKIAIDEIEILFLPEEQSALSLFEQKKIDWMKDISLVSRKAAWQSNFLLHFYPGMITYYLGLNAKSSKILENESLRKALSASLDHSELPKIFGKEVRGQRRWNLPLLSDPSEKAVNADFVAAKKVIENAIQNKEFDLRLRVYNKPAHRQLAEWLQGQWLQKLGVRIPIEVQEAKIYWKEIAAKPAPIFLSGITPPYYHPRAFLQEFLSGSSANWTSWKSKDYDSFIEREQYQQALALLQSSYFTIPLYSRGSAALLQSSWKGFWMNPMGLFYLKDVYY